MVDYSNPKIPEEINYSKDNPLKEFALLVAGVFGLVIATALLIHLLAQQFAHHIPFRYEAHLMNHSWLNAQFPDSANSAKRAYINRLAHRLAKEMALPKEITLNVHYSQSPLTNAFASLDGTIVITEGLLDFVESENELAFVLAHEIAHIRSRDPIQALSSQAALGVGLGLLGASIGSSDTTQIFMTSSTLTSLSFSRAQESHADHLALNALQRLYGHSLGSTDFFKRLQAKGDGESLLSFTSTHPNHKQRIQAIETHRYQHKSTEPTLTPLPSFRQNN